MKAWRVGDKEMSSLAINFKKGSIVGDGYPSKASSPYHLSAIEPFFIAKLDVLLVPIHPCLNGRLRDYPKAKHRPGFTGRPLRKQIKSPNTAQNSRLSELLWRGSLPYPKVRAERLAHDTGGLTMQGVFFSC